MEIPPPPRGSIRVTLSVDQNMSEDIICPNCGETDERYQDEDNKVRCGECDEVLGHTADFWSGEVHYDQTFDMDPCPFCGDEIFSVNFETGAQVVGSPRNSVDEQEGDFHCDDFYSFELTFVRCCNVRCERTLFDHKWDQAEIDAVPTPEMNPEEYLTEQQKDALLERAKEVAIQCYEAFDWGVDGCVIGGIDDAADDRHLAGFEGAREIAHGFLKNHEDEIEEEVLAIKELPFTIEGPLTGREIRIYRDEDTPSGRNWEYVDE